jgi:hypothetical protein
VPRNKKNADEALLLALACGANVDNAARTAGISPRTAHRRLASPEFQERLRKLRTDMVQRTTDMLRATGMEAVKTLVSLQDASQPATVRLGAARSLLELGMKLRESAEFEARLCALEQRPSHNPTFNDHEHVTPL